MTLDASLPARDQIAEEHWSGQSPQSKLVTKWFFEGGDASGLIEREGVNRRVALRTLKILMDSRSLEHNHKLAGVAARIAEWFEMKS